MTDRSGQEPLRARPPQRGRGTQRARQVRSLATALLLVAGGAVLGWGLPRVERHLPKVGLSFDASTAQATLAAIAGSMITLAGFVVTAITLVIQTVQAMSPRLVAALGHFSRYLVLFGMLVGTALYALVTLSQVGGDRVPRISVTLAVLLVLFDAVAVLYLLSSLRNAVTGGGLSRAVGERLRTVIDQTYPAAAATPPSGPAPAGPFAADLPPRTDGAAVLHPGRPGVVYRVDEPRLTRLAARQDVRVRLVRAVGDFVATGAVVARVEAPSGAADPRLLRKVARCMRFGPSRTVEQDCAYGFRLLADIAVRALSPAVNDPTTAVQAMDQIEDGLIRLAGRPLGPAWLVDADGRPRVSFPAPRWSDLVSLALDEILLYGTSNPQVVRRLRALLARVLAAAPPRRRPPVAERAAALDRLTAAAFPDVLLHDVASRPDAQGLGGSSAGEAGPSAPPRSPGPPADDAGPGPG
ncbi:DUF2254 domain-containing protein [Streptomyces sp. NPDC020917]|uniref:DUF2254 domain-containing protein n=1 Tax=Streptomyces sp. NPDC020917 TaxID=3365102 RepID=UPI00378D3ACE